MHGFSVALTPYNLMLMGIGIVLGVIIGVLPGLGGANGVAILLPLTFSMPPTSAIIMLSCIYWGALFGGAITSILFNIPGEPWSVATTFDGHPDGARRPIGRSADGRLYVVLRRRARRRHHDHVPGAGGRQVRAAVLTGRVLCRVLPDVRQLRRHEPRHAVQGRRRDVPGLRARRRRSRQDDRLAAPDVRPHRAALGLRLPHRRHRPVRHRRDPLLNRGRPFVQGQHRETALPEGAGDLEEAAELLGDIDPELHRRLLDGHHSGRRDACVVHVLRSGQTLLEERRQLRQG